MSTIPTHMSSPHTAHGTQPQAVVAASPAEQAYNTAVDFFSQHLGINTEAMSEFYNKFISNNEAYKQLGLYVGVDPEELGAEAKKRFSGANTEYISQRVAMLKQIGGALASSPTLNHLHNFFTYSQRSFEAAGGSVDELSPHIKEAYEAAKKAVKDHPEYLARLQSDVMAFIYDPEIRRLTSEELGRRFSELSKIDESPLRYSHRGFHGRLADFGVGGGATLATGAGIVGWLGRLGINWGEGKQYSRTQLAMKDGFWNRLFNGGSRHVSMARALEVTASDGLKHISIDPMVAMSNKPDFIQDRFKNGAFGSHNPLKMKVNGVVQEYKSYASYYDDLLKQANATKIAGLKNGIKATKLFSKEGWAARKALWGPQSKALLAQAGRKGGWVIAAAAAICGAYNYFTDHPEKIKPITNTVAKVGNGAKDLAVGGWNLFRENAIPDMGILYGSPWFEEGAQVA